MHTLESWACSAAKDAACSVLPSQNRKALVAYNSKQQNIIITFIITFCMLASTAPYSCQVQSDLHKRVLLKPGCVNAGQPRTLSHVCTLKTTQAVEVAGALQSVCSDSRNTDLTMRKWPKFCRVCAQTGKLQSRQHANGQTC